MARPVSLNKDLAVAKRAQIDTVVSLLEPSEAEALGLADEQDICVSLGLTFLSHPIRDMHLPDAALFAAFARDIGARITGGHHVAIHCRASIGRSGMLACAVLTYFGFDPEAALKHVSQQRKCPVPDTEEQAAFVRSLIASKQV
ncbi:MAG: hypothetical protein WBG95_01330 [Sulfitobacter sp.]